MADAIGQGLAAQGVENHQPIDAASDGTGHIHPAVYANDLAGLDHYRGAREPYGGRFQHGRRMFKIVGSDR